MANRKHLLNEPLQNAHRYSEAFLSNASDRFLHDLNQYFVRDVKLKAGIAVAVVALMGFSAVVTIALTPTIPALWTMFTLSLLFAATSIYFIRCGINFDQFTRDVNKSLSNNTEYEQSLAKMRWELQRLNSSIAESERELAQQIDPVNFISKKVTEMPSTSLAAAAIAGFVKTYSSSSRSTN